MIEIRFLGGNAKKFPVTELGNPWFFFAENIQIYGGVWEMDLSKADENALGYDEWLKADTAVRRMITDYGVEETSSALTEALRKALNTFHTALEQEKK